MAALQSPTTESHTTEGSSSPSSLPSDSSLAPPKLSPAVSREKSPTRLKRAHNKVRTGCITCRRRRVKCDEARPTCQRCTKADRVCEGYRECGPSHVPEKVQQPTLLPKAPHISDLSLCLESADMIRPFEHYLEEAASHMSLMFVSMVDGSLGDKLQVLDLAGRSHTLWSSIVPSMCQVESTLHYAVAALSSLHEWLHISQQPAWQNASFARFYSRAVSAVNMTADNSSSSAVTVLLSCLVFAQCEVLMASQGNAATQICSGLSIISDLRASSKLVPPVVDDYVAPIFNAFLALQNTPSPDLEFERHVCQDPVRRLIPALPTSFASTAHASESLHEVTYRTLLLQQLGEPVDRRFLMAVRKLANDWSTKFDIYRFSTTHGRDTDHLLLLAHHRMIQLLLKTMPPERDAHYEHAHHDFRVILSQICTFVSSSNDLDLSNNSLGLITPVFFVATQAPSIDLQVAALDTLTDLRVREGHWTSCMAHTIASRAVETSQRSDKIVVSVSQPRLCPEENRQGHQRKQQQTSPHHTHVRLDSVERLPGTNRLKLTYQLRPSKSQDLYAMTETIEASACIDKCDLAWVSPAFSGMRSTETTLTSTTNSMQIASWRTTASKAAEAYPQSL